MFKLTLAFCLVAVATAVAIKHDPECCKISKAQWLCANTRLVDDCKETLSKLDVDFVKSVKSIVPGSNSLVIKNLEKAPTAKNAQKALGYLLKNKCLKNDAEANYDTLCPCKCGQPGCPACGGDGSAPATTPHAPTGGCDGGCGKPGCPACGGDGSAAATTPHAPTGGCDGGCGKPGCPACGGDGSAAATTPHAPTGGCDGGCGKPGCPTCGGDGSAAATTPDAATGGCDGGCGKPDCPCRGDDSTSSGTRAQAGWFAAAMLAVAVSML
eukprot:g1207.t1